MTTTPTTVLAQVDAALDRLGQARAQATAQPDSLARSRQLAELADIEAAWWEVLAEHSHTRVRWRAALVAREYAQQTARTWRARAAAQQAVRSAARLPQVGVAA
jgi:hypothetical protein